MSKPHRGKSLWKLSAKGRGTCPVCHRTGVKLLYSRTISGEALQVCKQCREK